MSSNTSVTLSAEQRQAGSGAKKPKPSTSFDHDIHDEIMIDDSQDGDPVLDVESHDAPAGRSRTPPSGLFQKSLSLSQDETEMGQGP